MTVVLWDIDVNKRRANNTLSNTSVRDWTLDDYYDVAQRCIGAFAAGSMAQSMLRNEDAISFVAEHLMYAAYRWTESGGRTVNSYLNQCAIWSIHRWIVLTKRASKKSLASLNADNCPTADTKQLYTMVADDKTQTPAEVLMDQEQTDGLAHVIDDAGLTDRQRHCLEVVYVQGQKPAEVARDLGISRQAVDQCLTKGIRKIQGAIDGKEALFA